ncbi:response regulator [Cnuibacter physcomitrellae]|uniref:response regulator n=1 Tax=Cnuibacter physcomitrellae TaxID=1619308 RepID=UPI002175B388|nr:response regulator [Cnuibacter physcomitrellae]MCS5498105.1 response regulator [Cnuibacter physcomitrellae]
MTDEIGVLVVEDDEHTREVNARFVERVPGFVLTATAPDANSALRTLRADRDSGHPEISLVLLDMNLPDGHGLDVCRRLRASAIDVDVIAVTAASDVATVRSAVSLGIVQYLIKPFTFASFTERLEGYREFVTGVDATGTATQSEIDHAFASLRRGSSAPSLTKGLSDETMSRVLAVVRGESEISAREVAARAGLSRVSARRYLEHLVDSGALTRSTHQNGPGRPEIRYARTR